MSDVLPDRNRRRWLQAGAAGLLSAPLHAVAAPAAATPLRFGTTPVFLDDQIALLGMWQNYLESRLQRPVSFVQRGSYREIVDLLLGDGVDLAWLCGYPFVLYAPRLALLAVPSYQGAPLYRSYLIVPEADRSTVGVADLDRKSVV